MSEYLARKYVREYKLVASEVAREVAFLKETSCMNPERRFEIACCKIFIEYFSDDKKFNKFLKSKAIPSLEILGFAEWQRDILTDMGLRVSKKRKRASLKDLRK